MKGRSVMIVETNTETRNHLRHAFIDRGYHTWTCPGIDMALSIFTAVRPEIIVLDSTGEGNRAIELLDYWKKISPHTRVIIESDTVDVPKMQEAMEHGADAFLLKSFSLVPLFHLIENELPPPIRNMFVRTQAA